MVGVWVLLVVICEGFFLLGMRFLGLAFVVGLVLGKEVVLCFVFVLNFLVFGLNSIFLVFI